MERPRGSDVADRTKEAAQNPAREVRREAERGTGWYSWVARIGLVAKGVSYGIVGVLAIQVALGEGGEATSRQGALATIADEALGKVLLILLAFGFAAYALWRFVNVFVAEGDDDATGKAKKWGKRVGYLVRALIYAGLTYTTIKLVAGSGGGQSQNQEAKDTTAGMLDWPGGRWLVGLAGLSIIGVGAWNAYRGVSRSFEDDWRFGEMSKAERKWGSRVGVVGHLARGVVFSLIGIFIAKAAVEYDPDEAIGLDGALQKLAEASYGSVLLGVTAAGLICYGLYCLVDARYRDVSVTS